MTINNQVIYSTAVVCSAVAGFTFLLEHQKTTQLGEDGNERRMKPKIPHKTKGFSWKTTPSTPSNCRGKGTVLLGPLNVLSSWTSLK